MRCTRPGKHVCAVAKEDEEYDDDSLCEGACAEEMPTKPRSHYGGCRPKEYKGRGSINSSLDEEDPEDGLLTDEWR